MTYAPGLNMRLRDRTTSCFPIREYLLFRVSNCIQLKAPHSTIRAWQRCKDIFIKDNWVSSVINYECVFRAATGFARVSLKNIFSAEWIIFFKGMQARNWFLNLRATRPNNSFCPFVKIFDCTDCAAQLLIKVIWPTWFQTYFNRLFHRTPGLRQWTWSSKSWRREMHVFSIWIAGIWKIIGKFFL